MPFKNNSKPRFRVDKINIIIVACKVEIWKKYFVKIVISLVTVLLKMTLCLCIYFVFTKNTLF